jgi:hypothetical protein
MSSDDRPAAHDYYVRLPASHLPWLSLRHLRSEIEERTEPNRSPLAPGAQASTLSGYSDWLWDGDPPVNVSWDWEMDAKGHLALNPHSIRTDLMLIDAQGLDLGHSRTLAALLQRVAREPWHEAVLAWLKGTP